MKEISNFRNPKKLQEPSYVRFYSARIVICTLVNCGRIVSAGISRKHFDYIFIDEAGCKCEQRALMPIAGLGIFSEKVNAQIVLSGDHKQLGPVIKNSFAQKMGMEVSL